MKVNKSYRKVAKYSKHCALDGNVLLNFWKVPSVYVLLNTTDLEDKSSIERKKNDLAPLPVHQNTLWSPPVDQLTL